MDKGHLKRKDQSVISEVKIASSFWDRFVGLMGKKPVSDSDVILFPHCNAVHTFFMRESIDVVFVSANGSVAKIFNSLKPWRLLWPQKKAVHCIEMAGERTKLLGIVEGESLVCKGVFE